MKNFAEFTNNHQGSKISIDIPSITALKTRGSLSGSIVFCEETEFSVDQSYEEVKSAINAWYTNNSTKELSEQNQDGVWVPYTVNPGDGDLEERRIWIPGVNNKNQEFVIVKVILPEQEEEPTL